MPKLAKVLQQGHHHQHHYHDNKGFEHDGGDNDNERQPAESHGD